MLQGLLLLRQNQYVEAKQFLTNAMYSNPILALSNDAQNIFRIFEDVNLTNSNNNSSNVVQTNH